MKTTNKIKKYSYSDPIFINLKGSRWFYFILGILVIILAWFFLNYKFLFGGNWISETYENVNWRTNEDNLQTHGAWDFEAHVWKSEYIMKNFPHFQWNPYWYMGSPLIKYYQPMFYFVNILVTLITKINLAKSALLVVIFGQLLAAIFLFILSYKFSRSIIAATILPISLIGSYFITLRSYGWEPISIAFMFLFPLALLIYFKEPLRPLRFSMAIILTISYLAHPLIFFSVAMVMGLYIFSISIEKRSEIIGYNNVYIQYFAIIFIGLMIGAVQFFPQLSYKQVTSGAHMGVKYIPFYHVQYNVITLKDFFFGSTNLKGPGPIVLAAIIMIIFFALTDNKRFLKKDIFKNSIIRSLMFILFVMILFYYLEEFNIFPMNVLSGIQYHRIIPEIIIVSALVIASLSNIITKPNQKIFYYSVLSALFISYLVMIYLLQLNWQTINDISNKPEFLKNDFVGRISFPYSDQSLSVRNSFTEIPQVYGYYEQGITNPYADELFSVSSGFHNSNLTLLYLEATNVKRVYINNQEGERDKITFKLLSPLKYYTNKNDRYGYFEIPLKDPSYSQAVDINSAESVRKEEPGCRVLYQEKYCGSVNEEFVSSDYEEIRYLQDYVTMLNEPYNTTAEMKMINPEDYQIKVTASKESSAVIIKMTYDSDFHAYINNKEIKIEKVGPDFMLLIPKTAGDYTIELKYKTSKVIIIGAIISILSLILTILFFIFWPRFKNRIRSRLNFKKGDL